MWYAPLFEGNGQKEVPLVIIKGNGAFNIPTRSKIPASGSAGFEYSKVNLNVTVRFRLSDRRNSGSIGGYGVTQNLQTQESSVRLKIRAPEKPLRQEVKRLNSG